ncbi:MAG TPA: aminoglycoside phosphotransferase family protein, partial [Burkholderiales bacterium]
GRIGSPVAAEPVCSVLSQATGLRLAPEQMTWTLLSYLPGRRCTARARWPCAPLGFVGKLGEGAGPNHDRMQALWESADRGFGMPQPVSCDPAAELRWEYFVSGARIEEFGGEAGFAAAVARIAPGLAALHAMKLPGLAREAPERVLDRLRRKVVPRVCGALPAVTQAAHAVAATLEEKLATLSPAASYTLHGDLHTANVLVDGEAAVFIDLDNLTQGDPAYDLAMLGTRSSSAPCWTARLPGTRGGWWKRCPGPTARPAGCQSRTGFTPGTSRPTWPEGKPRPASGTMRRE